MKKIALLFIVIFLIMVLCACGKTEQPTEVPTAEPTEAAAPTEVSTEPTTEPTTAPTEATTPPEAPTETTAPESPTEDATQAPTQAPTAEPTEEPTEEPTTEVTEQQIVYYDDFGAIGDGVSDDFSAICAAHEYANSNSFSVKATVGATYYIGQDSIGKQIEIKTDTDWTGAKFIIDDRNVTVGGAKDYLKPIFRVAPSVECVETAPNVIKGSPLSAGDTNIGYAPGKKCLAVIENDYSSVFIRTGIHAGNGETKKEIVLVDENGDIDESTPLNWEFKIITSRKIYHIDEAKITIRGGEFLTLTNVQAPNFTYFHRNIIVERSNVTLEGITHLTEGENDDGGAPYHGFIYVHNCINVNVNNCVFTPHYIFGDQSKSASASYGYDVHVNTAVNVKFTGCTQTISIDDANYWGVFTSNFGRNITLENCIWSRFDAHRGVYNVTVKNCVFGHQGLRFVGFGFSPWKIRRCAHRIL
ncbi:MAG: hypothetical protein J5860_03985 [Clostridia bacterium]|nr:hypothetical protein [Clostridia bacterium]